MTGAPSYAKGRLVVWGQKKKGTSMKKMKNRLTAIAAVAFASVLACGVLAGCSSDKGEQKAEQPEQTAAATLEGKSLNIYCGAGMTKPFQEIADAFKAETGCEMNITFANAAQIQTQISTTQEGDFFIAGSPMSSSPSAIMLPPAPTWSSTFPSWSCLPITPRASRPSAIW